MVLMQTNGGVHMGTDTVAVTQCEQAFRPTESHLLINVSFYNINNSFPYIKLNHNCRTDIHVSKGSVTKFGICKYKPAAIWYVLHVTTDELC